MDHTFSLYKFNFDIFNNTKKNVWIIRKTTFILFCLYFSLSCTKREIKKEFNEKTLLIKEAFFNVPIRTLGIYFMSSVVLHWIFIAFRVIREEEIVLYEICMFFMYFKTWYIKSPNWKIRSASWHFCINPYLNYFLIKYAPDAWNHNNYIES